MPDSTQPNNESTASDQNKDVSLSWGPDSGFQGKIATMLVPNNCILTDIRVNKVLAIRQQLADGIYSMDKRLDASLGRLLEDINT